MRSNVGVLGANKVSDRLEIFEARGSIGLPDVGERFGREPDVAVPTASQFFDDVCVALVIDETSFNGVRGDRLQPN